MATAQVSNRNQRTMAMLKVAGLYLVTVIILALLFWRNAGVGSEESEKLTEENQQLKSELAQLRQMISIQDSLRDKTNLLIDLTIENPGRSTAQIQDLRVAISDFSRELSRLMREAPAELDAEIRAISETRNVMDHALAEISKLLESQDEVSDNQEDEVDELDSQIKDLESQLRIEQEKVAMRDERIAVLKGGGQGGGDDLIQLQDKMTTLKVELAAVQGDLDGLTQDIRARFEESRLPGQKKDLTLWITDLTAILSKLDQLSR